jgi:hypothetical protein
MIAFVSVFLLGFIAGWGYSLKVIGWKKTARDKEVKILDEIKTDINLKYNSPLDYKLISSEGTECGSILQIYKGDDHVVSVFCDMGINKITILDLKSHASWRIPITEFGLIPPASNYIMYGLRPHLV